MPERISHQGAESSGRMTEVPDNIDELEEIDRHYRGLIFQLQSKELRMDRLDQKRNEELEKLRARESELIEAKRQDAPKREALRARIEQLRECQRMHLAEAALESTVHVASQEERASARPNEQGTPHLRAVPALTEVYENDGDSLIDRITRTIEKPDIETDVDELEEVEEELDIEKLIEKEFTGKRKKPFSFRR